MQCALLDPRHCRLEFVHANRRAAAIEKGLEAIVDTSMEADPPPGGSDPNAERTRRLGLLTWFRHYLENLDMPNGLTRLPDANASALDDSAPLSVVDHANGVLEFYKSVVDGRAHPDIKTHVMTFSATFRGYLAIQASNCSSERLFSLAKAVIEGRSLSEWVFEQEVLMKRWMQVSEGECRSCSLIIDVLRKMFRRSKKRRVSSTKSLYRFKNLVNVPDWRRAKKNEPHECSASPRRARH